MATNYVGISIGATDGAKPDLDALKAKLDELKGRVADARADVDTKDGQAKMLRLEAQLAALGKRVASPRIDMAGAARALADVAAVDVALDGLGEKSEKSGAKSGQSFGTGFGAQGYLIGGGVAAALAALPALAAGGGAVAGIALGAGLLIGTKQVQGPLYSQFHSMTQGLMSVLRVAALPLVKPLGDAFAQVGKWAKALYPLLHAVFGSLGPLVAPLTRGLMGLVSGVLPGFLRLMQSARPAVQALGAAMSQIGKSVGGALGQMAPAIKASSQFLSGLSGVVSSLMPVVAGLANVLSSALGPWMQQIGQKVAPVLARSILQVLNSVMPLLPSLSTLTGLLVQVAAQGIGVLAGPLAGLIGALSSLAARVLPSVIPPIETLIGWLATLANAANRVLSLLSHVPGLGFLGGAGSGASFSIPSFSLPSGGTGSTAGYSAAVAGASAGGYGSWADGITGVTKGPGAGSGAGSNAGSNAAASAARKRADELAQLGLQITSAFANSLSNSKSAAAVKSGVNKLLGDVKAAWQAGIISLGTDESLTRWLDAQSAQLQNLAAKRAGILGKIAEARKFAASTASSVYGNYQFSDFATSGLNGQPATAGSIVSSLQADVSGVRAFAANVKKLAKAGLNKGYLNQLIQMGPVQGAALAAELASSGLGEIKAINSAEYQLSEASGQLGKTAANAMYDSGAQAGKGFLSGLQAQASAINKMMQTIAKNMVATLRKELGIHSPSTVLHGDGFNSGLGVALGAESSIPRIVQSMKKVAAAVRLPAAGQPGAAALGAGAGGAAVKLQLEVTGSSDDFLTKWLRQKVRLLGGGSVQRAFGYGAG